MRTPLPWFAGLCLLGLAWSFAGTRDVGVWCFEVLPLLAVLVVFALRIRQFRFTHLAYALLTVFFLLQCLGGRYTFAEAPVPHDLLAWLGLERNPMDRLGHFCQGFVPAILLREWLIRRRGMAAGGTVFWLVTGCCLGFSASYELLEMATVRIWYPTAGPEWLGLQGDPWDAQMDMAMALCGAVLAQLLLGRWHDRLIARAA